MVFPQSVTYALDALCYLVRSEPDTYVKVKVIAEDLNIPEHFLGKVLTQLVRKHIVSSSRGPTGGLTLSENPKRLTVYDVIVALDAQEQLEGRCLLGLEQCSGRDGCPFHAEWSRFNAKIVSVAKKTTLARLAKI
jgi:Rrf2 family protein